VRRSKLSRSEARRIAVTAQGFADPRPTGRVDRRHFRRVIDRIGILQIDSVNVLVRSQELPLFARLGPHPRTYINEATERGDLFEYWVHMASHIPTDHYHLWRWRMEEQHQWKGVRRIEQRRPGYLDKVLDYVRENGPILASDLEQRRGPKSSWWDWDDGKIALEHLFDSGLIAARRRPNDFARVYDVTERMIPADVLARPAPPEHEARKELLMLAARSLGVATLSDLCDYHRQKTTPCRPILNELLEEDRLVPVEVESWDRPAYVHPDATLPRTVPARALLSPFDSLIWYRERTERLFGFHYRIEIYTPPPKRRFGYSVLPFQLGDELVARVDLKADRKRGVLLVQGAYGEPGIFEEDVAAEMIDELRLIAGWLDLDDGIELNGRGDLSPALADQAATLRVSD
jgi:uncharacterized protein YcaQ